MSRNRRIALHRVALAAALGVSAFAAQAQTALHPATSPAQKTARAVPAAPPAAVAFPAAPCGRLEVAALVQLPVGKSTVIRPGTPIARILLGNPENARAARPSEAPDDARDVGLRVPAAARPGVADVDVLLLGPTEVYLLGKTLGSTNVVMIDRQGVCTAFDVVVGLDTTALQGVIAQLLPDEKDIRVSAAFDSVVLKGTVSDSEALARVADLANAYVRSGDAASPGPGGTAARNPRIVNMLDVAAPQQVMLEVKVAEVAKTLLDQFGIDFSRAYVPGDGSMMRFLSGVFGGSAGLAGQVAGTVGARVGGGVIGSGSNGQATGGWTGQAGDAKFGENPTIPLAVGKNLTQLSLNMQKTDGAVKVLAEPSIMAISGQTGSFLAGGKIFIPVATTSDGGARTVTLEEKEFGVSVRFTPTVLGNGRINLRVRPEVSELNAAGITVTGLGGNTVLPSFTSRRAETTVQLMDGQSFAIGGLIKNNTTANVKAFPFLGEIPVLGVLFRSTEFQTNRSELVFVITPRLVKPLPADYRLPTDNYQPPTRKELILDGKVESSATPPTKEVRP